MAKSSKTEKTEQTQVSVGASELAQALTAAIEAAKPPTKKTVFNRKKGTPWTPEGGAPKLKLKRKIYQHGMPVSESRLTNEQIALCNKIRPGVFGDGHFRVVRRRDKGINIDYPIRTSQQRLKLVHQFGIRNFTELLEYLIREAEKPKKSEFDVDTDE